MFFSGELGVFIANLLFCFFNDAYKLYHDHEMLMRYHSIIT